MQMILLVGVACLEVRQITDICLVDKQDNQEKPFQKFSYLDETNN
jgi:hypothetical protein